MAEAFLQLSPVAQALLATGFTWSMTALGAVFVLAAQPLLPYALSFAAFLFIMPAG